ncbi:carbohydrate ABC transporter permease [Paenibacillus sp. sptzw28]|uniref:carbohydrate ABC transporter permease n=1 Tax=Paenibacillus sp. sptzw28 TaxID=715179 RepID=UPI001C6EFDCB|nr:carbohydrate ABC transporter permease [Paenibacillus sp. sptzw28]QYR22885.1 carbohydrate ABC transporter permease [Paenibacillus sp. sptzw28]
MSNALNPVKLLLTVIMFILGLAFLLPFFWMLSTSFKVEADVFKFPIEWIPKTWNAVNNYSEVWNGQYPFAVYYWNTIKVTVVTTITSVLFSSMAAYGFSKVNFKGKDVLFIAVLVTYMVPQQAILVPQFILYRWLGLFDSHIGLILLGSFSVLGTFMLRQFFMSIHNEFIESAKIDGASHIRIFAGIAFPLVRPAIATYAILRFIWTWNDYQNALVFIRSDHMYTLQLAIRKFADAYSQHYSLIMAGAVSAIIPLLIIFILGQKQVIEGIAVGGVKG